MRRLHLFVIAETSPILSNETKKSFSNNENAKLPLVIVNPKSASGSTETRWAQIASDLRTHFGAFQVAFTKKAGDGVELARQGAAGGREFIIACGGKLYAESRLSYKAK